MVKGTSMSTPGERLAQLKQQHGSLKDAVKTIHEYTYIVYDENGDIFYKSIVEPTDLKDELYVAKFKTVDCKIIDEQGKSAGLFYIEKDEHDVCHIRLKTFETVSIKSDKHFLSEIKKSNTTSYDIKIIFTDKKFTVTAHDNIIKNKKFKNTNIKFYITEHKDPHFIIDSYTINTDELYTNKSIHHDHKLDTTNLSIYTIKIFDKYVRT